MTHPTPRAAHRTARRALTTTIALAAAGLMLAPGAAFAAGGPGGPAAPSGSDTSSTAPAPAPQSPGPKAPDSKVPGPKAPGSKTPGGPKKPGSKTPGGSKKPGSKTPKSPAPKPSDGPVQTVTKIVTTKVPTAAKPVSISVRVSPVRRGGPGRPAETGTVVITVDGTAGTPIRVAKNRASEKLKLTAGEHTISAQYSGDGAHAASESGPVTITVS